MANCIWLITCPLLNGRLKDLPGLSDLYKQQYCRKDSASCARVAVREAVGRDKVPPDLYPTQHERAQKIIAAAGDPGSAAPNEGAMPR